MLTVGASTVTFAHSDSNRTEQLDHLTPRSCSVQRAPKATGSGPVATTKPSQGLVLPNTYPLPHRSRPGCSHVSIWRLNAVESTPYIPPPCHRRWREPSSSWGSSSSWMLEEAPQGGTPRSVFQESSMVVKLKGGESRGAPSSDFYAS
jgi:hypothetical protein